MIVSVAATAQNIEPQPDLDGVYAVGQGIKPPKIVHTASPTYPPDPRLAGFKHSCTFNVVIGADGIPTEIRPEDTRPDPFAASGLAAIKESQFAKGTLHGKPIPVRIKIWVPFTPGDKHAVPEILPIKLSAHDMDDSNNRPPIPLSSPEAEFIEEARKADFHGVVAVSVLVTDQGLPENSHVVKPLGNGLDAEAEQAVSKYRFAPALRHGIPISYEITIEVNSTPTTSQLPVCPAKFNDSIDATGIAGTFGNGVTFPKPTMQPEAEFSDEARRLLKRAHIENFQGASMIGLLVDVNGMPQELCLKKALGYGLDIQAEKAVRQYRFIPAMKDGKPVPARLIIEVHFKRY
jgi:TonB family protein